MNSLSWLSHTALRSTALFVLVGLFAPTVDAGDRHAQATVGTAKRIASFTPESGTGEYGGLTSAPDGNLYGTTRWDGKFGHGTFFRVTPSGKIKVLHHFTGALDGEGGQRPILGNDGALYGLAYGGGAGFGMFYRMTLGGKFKMLHALDASEGLGEMTLARDGNFYGSVLGDGTRVPGSIFKITSAGKYKTIASFDLAGYHLPRGVPLLGDDDQLYLQLSCFGTNCDDPGAVVSVSSSGRITIRHVFREDEGRWGGGQMAYDTSHAYMYGMTYRGYFFRYSNDSLEVVGHLDVGFGPPPIDLTLGPDSAHFYLPFSRAIYSVDLLGNFDTVAIVKGAMGFQPPAFDATGVLYGTTYRGGPTGYGGVFKVVGF